MPYRYSPEFYSYGGLRRFGFCWCNAIGNGVSGAGFRALRVATTQVTLGNLAGVLIVIDGAIGARDGADFTADTFVISYLNCAGLRTTRDGARRAGLHAPGIRALGAGIGN